MKELVSQKFKFTDEVLKSGAIANADSVVIKDGKVKSCNGTIKVDENIIFSYNAYEDIKGNLSININNAPLSIDAHEYIREFIAVVEN